MTRVPKLRPTRDRWAERSPSILQKARYNVPDLTSVATRTLLLLLLASCSSPPKRASTSSAPSPHVYQELDQPTQPPPRDVEALDEREVTADLDVLVYALERGYVGRPFVRKTSWADMMQRLTGLKGKPSSVRELCDAVADALWQLPDFHLGARRRGPKDKASTKCGTLYEKAVRAPSVGDNIGAEASARAWTSKSVTIGRSAVGLLSIRDFPLKDDSAWTDFERVVRELMQKDGLLIDLRGNGGGDDARGRQLANLLVDGEVASGVTRWHARKTPETLTLLMNRYATQGGAEHVQKLLVETKRERDEAVAGRLPEWKIEQPAPQRTTVGSRSFPGPIAVLVDAACASSCESTLQFLRAHPKARVFGERTAGHLHFGDIGMLALPNSRIRVIIPTGFAELASGFHDRTGLEPDVPTPAGTNAFDPAMKWIAEQASRSSGEKRPR